MKRLEYWLIVISLAVSSCTGGVPGRAGGDATRHARPGRGFQTVQVMVDAESYEFREMTAERLPDLNIPRAGHMVRCIDGELTVFGGHTTGFIPTGTAEYYKDGKWQLMGMIYPHDDAAMTPMPSGTLVLFCGCEKPLGVGQTSYVESYDRTAHKFRPMPELDWRSARPSAVCLSDGTVVVSGNWWREDAIITWSPDLGKLGHIPPSYQRTNPIILPVAADDAIVFAASDNSGRKAEPIVDRLRGEPFEEPLLREWSPYCFESSGSLTDQLSVGNPAKGEYIYLFTAVRNDRQTAIIKVDGTSFSLLNLERPFPKTGLDGEPLAWFYLLTDKSVPCAWVPGLAPGSGRLYFARVDYADALSGGNAPVEFYFADMPEMRDWAHVYSACMPDGRIACVGGGMDNYDPSAFAIILHTDPPRRFIPVFLIPVICLLTAATVVLILIRRKRKKEPAVPSKAESVPAAVLDERMTRLMEQITAQMEEKELFRKSGLTKDDLAKAVFSNTRYVSDCINAVTGRSFIDFVNDYRIRYAQRLLYENPDLSISEISEESGFSSDVTFYRNFKSRTGQTPGEWLSAQKLP